MPVINDFIDDFVDEHEVLPDTFLIKNPTVVPEYFHHAVKDVHDKGGGDVVFRSCNEKDPKLLCVEEVDSFNVL